MAAIEWLDVRGQTFNGDEAREASDFKEVISQFDLEPQMVFDMFHKEETMSVAKRLILAVDSPLDAIALMLIEEPDSRIRLIIQARLREDRQNDCGIIC
jgi:hypothetical protein